MLPRVLFLDGVPGEVDHGVVSTLPIVAEFADWATSDAARLRGSEFDLLVAVADASPKASTFFESLIEWPALRPTLAVFMQDDALAHAASRLVDDFIVAPVRPSELSQRISRILGSDPTASREHQTWRKLSSEIAFAGLVGAHPSFVHVLGQIELAARSNCSVIITGETGTGKELCARALHHLGARRHRPFIPVDCAALPEHLFENEMFGHARGAFTDAHRDQKGLIDLAAGGTLFLDEIDSLGTSAQAKLLRFIQERSYRPVGSARFHDADVRVVAATNKDLEVLVRDGQFRSDLFFRLNVVRLHMVPLRERRSDIPLLARHFLDAIARESGVSRKTLSPAAMRRLLRHDWPGNVRELHNLIQRAEVFSPGPQVHIEHIGNDTAHGIGERQAGGNFREARAQTVAAFERAFIEDALSQAGGNVTHAARLVQKDRRVFGRLMKRHNITRDGA